MTAFELIKHLIPQFYLDIKEMHGIYKVDGKMLDKLFEGIETVKSNQFVLTADETVVKRIEKFFDFSVDYNNSLMDRKQHIITYLAGFGKMSKTKVVEIIRHFTDAGSEMTLDLFNDNKDHALFITLDRGIKEGVSWDKLLKTLADRLPAHLAFTCSLSYSNGSFTADGYTYEDMAQFTHEKLAEFIVSIEEVV